MSKIMSIVVRDDVSVVLSSGVSISFSMDYYRDFLNDLVGIEVFDLESIDNIIRCDSDVSFFLSKVFLKLGALESGVPIFKYIGDGDCIPSIIYKNKVISINCCSSDFSNLDVIDVSDFLTVSDLINSFMDRDVIMCSNDDIVIDIAVGLGISFVMTDDISFIDKLISVCDDL